MHIKYLYASFFDGFACIDCYDLTKNLCKFILSDYTD